MFHIRKDLNDMKQICDNCDKSFDRICFCSAACRIKFNNNLRRKVKKQVKPEIRIPTIQQPIRPQKSWEEIKKSASFL